MRHMLAVTIFVSSVGTFSSPSTSAPTQPATHGANAALGVWRGSSMCLVRPSACNDEIVVYRIAATSRVDSLTIDARKVVSGVEEEMGVLSCGYQRSTATLSCPIPRGLWQFQVRGDSLLGSLRLSDQTKFRDVKTRRSNS